MGPLMKRCIGCTTTWIPAGVSMCDACKERWTQNGGGCPSCGQAVADQRHADAAEERAENRPY
jgi:predicted amidophosphoribosyltransferase